MGRVVNYASLRPSIRAKLKGYGYKEDPGGKTASRKDKKKKSPQKEAQDNAKKIAAENAKAIKERGQVAYEKALAKQNARKASTIAATTKTTAAHGYSSPATFKEDKKGGFKNVLDVLSTSLNPFSKNKVAVSPSVPGALPQAALSYMANKPFSTALAATGVTALAKGVTTAVAKVTGKTLVQQIFKTGTKGLIVKGYKVGKIPGYRGTAATFPANSKNIRMTTSWLSKTAIALGITTAAAGGIMTVIGTYPFAGFIKEEALQTLGMGVKSALNNDDLENADAALALEKDILNEEVWEEIKSKIPFVNILDNLDDFYQAAKLKVVIDEKVVDDKRRQLETGETEDQKWERIKEEQAAEDQANIDYYNTERQKLVNWELEAKAAAAAATREAEIAARNADAAFWAKEQAKQRELEEKDREAQAAFWLAYRKATQKANEESRPSNLKFGLL